MCKTQRLALAAARIKNNSKLQSKGKAEGGGKEDETTSVGELEW